MKLYPLTMSFENLKVVITPERWEFASIQDRLRFEALPTADRLHLRCEFAEQVRLAASTPNTGDTLMNAKMPTPPAWAVLLTDEDEWVVRTALSNVASDLERVANSNPLVTGNHAIASLRESAARYRDVLARIEEADADDEKVERKFEMWSPDGSYRMGNITATSKTAALEVARGLYGPSIAASQIKDPS